MAKLELEPKWLRRRCPNELFHFVLGFSIWPRKSTAGCEHRWHGVCERSRLATPLGYGCRRITASVVLTDTKRQRNTRPNSAPSVEARVAARVPIPAASQSSTGHRRHNTRPVTRTAACDWATKAPPRDPGSLCKENHHDPPTASTRCIAW